MERPEQRTKQFNPEAAAFNPLFNPPPSQDAVESLAGSSVPQLVKRSSAMAPMFNYSPFDDVGSTRSLCCSDRRMPAPIRLEDFLPPDIQTHMTKLEEHPGVHEIPAPQTLEPAAPVAEARESTPSLLSFTFPTPQPRTHYTKVNIDELSAGLGLPSAKADADADASSAASRKSRVSQAHPGALYGKLIGLALDKPLTAKGLAEFLQNPDTNTLLKSPAPPAVSPTRTVISQNTDATPKKPGSRLMETNDKSTLRRGAPIDTDTASIGPSTHQHRRSSTSTVSYRQHTRVTSQKRFARRSSRATKRMDQGPMPSAADIYPDDAHFTPSAPIFEGNDYLSSNRAELQTHIIVDNPFNWPPPAQVYAPLPQPSLADINDADLDVLALMNELPFPSLCTVARLGESLHLRFVSSVEPDSAASQSDQRALSPGQQDGSRYGLRFWGLGSGDQWELPVMGDFGANVPFRVRPKEHEGWGGWEEALDTGWGAQPAG